MARKGCIRSAGGKESGRMWTPEGLSPPPPLPEAVLPVYLGPLPPSGCPPHRAPSVTGWSPGHPRREKGSGGLPPSWEYGEASERVIRSAELYPPIPPPRSSVSPGPPLSPTRLPLTLNLSLLRIHRSALPCQLASNLHPLSPILHTERPSPASCPLIRMPRNNRPGPDGPEAGQRKGPRGGGGGGCFARGPEPPGLQPGQASWKKGSRQE